MKIEAVVICVDYADFLAHTLPTNKALFDRLVVVTTPEDKLTAKLCEYWNVQVVQTDAFNVQGGEFRKGAGINVGLDALDMDGWVVHLDADIALAPQTRSLLQATQLDPTMVYGIDRFNILGYDQWFKHLRKPKLVNEASVYIHPHVYPLATRFMSPGHGGYLPIGFFQMWNPRVSNIFVYPECHSNAGRTDMLFSSKWPRAKRAMLPEIIGFHLESEKAAQGANWNGRKTSPFESRRWWRRWCHRRHRRHHPVPFPYHHKEHEC